MDTRLFSTRLLSASLFAGCCLLATPALAQTDAGNTDSFTLNLKDADITTLIATVSEVTGRNFVVDPRVKGDVTVLSNQSMTPTELYQTFLSVLDVHGFSAVPSGEVIKIIPQINAKQDGGFGRNTATDEDMVTKVIHVTNVPADQLVPILRPLVPQYGHLAAYAASNTLIISDREANVARLTAIVNRIDSNGSTSVNRIHLENASAEDVAAAIDKLQGQDKNSGAMVVPDERTNSVIISGNTHDRERLRGIVADMDTKSETTGGTQVFYLNYADAEDIAPVLQAYATGQSYSAGGGRSSRSSLGSSGLSSNSNSSGGIGSSSGISRSRSTAAAGISGGASEDGISVIAESGSNALIVTAPATRMAEIKHVIDKLDIRRGQVLVEAIIAEVSLSRSRNLGINLAALGNDGPAAASILSPDTLSSVGSLANNGTPLSLIQQGLNVALGNISDGGTSFALLLNALSGNADTNILSTPSLITRDNEEAEIKVGQEVPFLSGSYTNNNSGGGLNGSVNPFNTVERKDVGLTLSFIPQISAGDTIQLTINQEVSSIAQNSGASGAVDLITNNRTLKTAVEIQNGQILVLGGLIDDNVQTSRQQVPVLGDIPILGALFRYTSTTKDKRNLLNFIRPTILRGDGEANYYTAQKYNYIRRLQTDQSREQIPLMRDQRRPQLPAMENFQGGINSSAQFNSTGDDVQDNADREGRQRANGVFLPSGGGPANSKRRGDQFSPGN